VELAENGVMITQGYADPSVKRVEIVSTGSGETSVADLAELSPQLADEIGLDDHIGFFVAFTRPADITATGARGRFTKQDAHRVLATLTLRTFGSSGEIIAEQSLDSELAARFLSHVPPVSRNSDPAAP
jgi:hypothetical protein